jgi:hypothetical protein
MARVTRDEARAFMLNRIEQIKQDKVRTNRIPFGVVRALSGNRGFLFSLDTYAFHLCRVWRTGLKFWLARKALRAKRLIFCSRLWNTVMATWETAQAMPIAKRVSQREGIPLHQVIQGAITQVQFLQERHVVIEPQVLLHLYDKGTSIAQVNQFLRYAVRTDVSTDQVTEAFGNAFDAGAALTVTTCNAGEIHLSVPKLVRG